MLRTVELGRAVLASQSANLELWLTTLITVSLEQSAASLQQLNANAFLDVMASGDIWAGRSNTMHISFEITSNGDPLDHRQLERLAGSIIDAPVGLFTALECVSNSSGMEAAGSSTCRSPASLACR